MQVKKFEAETLAEALEQIKRELGPEAVILQTKKTRKGFGPLAKNLIEVTAAISIRSFEKKVTVERALPEPVKQSVNRMGAQRQADLYEQMLDREASRETSKASLVADRVSLSNSKQRVASTDQSPYAPSRRPEPAAGNLPQSSKPITTRRYIDIDDEELPNAPPKRTASAPVVSNGGLGMQLQNTSLENQQELRAELEKLKNELQQLQQQRAVVPREIPSSQPDSFQDATQRVFEQLILAGIERRIAFDLIQKAKFHLRPGEDQNANVILDRVALEMMDCIQTISPISARSPNRVIVLVGPTGVGKTTTLAKIASFATMRHKLKVGVINLDQFRVGAMEQIGTFCRILQLPFRSAASKVDFKNAIQELQSSDLIIVDTAGFSPKDPGALVELQDWLKEVPSVSVHLVLSACVRDLELHETVARATQSLRPQGITFSKLDETHSFGAIYNVSERAKLPLLYFTTGQTVPDDIEEASAERLTSLILDLGRRDSGST